MEFPKGRLDLYLTDISEPSDNDLRVVVLDASAHGAVEQTELGSARLIGGVDQQRAFELIWWDYVAYAMVNESYARLEDGEEPSPDRLSVRSASAFLNYVAATTFATDDFPGPLTHWSLITLNHCLDVVSTTPPEIRLLNASERTRGPTTRNWART